jgi:NADPH:quinone reductase-like Zn-dependent oxidoreductase
MPYLHLDLPGTYPVEVKRKLATRLCKLYAEVMETQLWRPNVGIAELAQSATAIAAAWRDVIPLIVGGSVNPIVERVYPLGEAGEALRHLIEDRPFGKVVLAG